MSSNRTGMTFSSAIAESEATPFPYFVISTFFDPKFATSLCEWLASVTTWEQARHHFYDQYELNFVRGDHRDPQGVARSVTAAPALRRVLSIAGNLFGVSFRPYVSVTAHKLVSGQGIGVHTDRAEGQESHRLLVQLSKGWRDSQGGQLVLFSGPRVEDAQKVIRHVFNTAVAFKLGRTAFHAVSDVVEGERLTLIYGLWSNAAPFDVNVQGSRTVSVR